MVLNSLPREARLTKSGEIRFVFRLGRRVDAKEIEIIWLPRKSNYQMRGRTTSRVCVVVGKRFVRIAARRNRLRRLAKEFFRLNKSRIDPQVDIVVRISSCNLFNYKDLARGLEIVFKKAGLISD